MKITIFTSNQSRHNYLINKISEISDEIFVIQENKNIILSKTNVATVSNIKKDYFSKVEKAQNLIFNAHSAIINKSKNKILQINMGELSSMPFNIMKDYLKSDLYIVFGSSYIKDKLIDFLIGRDAINIHMGVSPYYRGTACNFWALHDNNPHLVGATIHKLTKGLDDGPIIYHAISEQVEDYFIYTMSTVKSAILSLCQIIQKKKLDKFIVTDQVKTKQIRYTRHIDFNDKAIINFNNIKIEKKAIDFKILKDYFLLKKEDFFL